MKIKILNISIVVNKPLLSQQVARFSYRQMKKNSLVGKEKSQIDHTFCRTLRHSAGQYSRVQVAEIT